MGSSWSYYKLGEPYDSEWLAWEKAHCPPDGTPDNSSPMFCYWNNATFNQYPDWLKDSIVSMNAILRQSYAATRENILELCCPGLRDEKERARRFDILWPAFHWWYNNTHGRQRVDKLLSELDFPLPQEAISTIKLNFLESNQRKYCIMHGARYNRSMLGAGQLKGDINTLENNGLWWWDHRNPLGYRDTKRTLREQNSFKEDYEPIRGEAVDPRYETFRLQRGKPGLFEQHMVDPGLIGNPLWTNEQRKAAVNKMLPEGFNDLWNEIYVSTGKIAPDCTYDSCWEPKYEAGIKGNFFGDPEYGGKEPQLANTFHPYAIPGMENQYTGGAGSTWRNPCDATGFLETAVPWVAAAVGAALPLILLPRNIGTYFISAGAAGGFYFVAQDLYGFDALFSIGDSSNADMAAACLTLGVGGGGILFLHETGFYRNVGLELTDTSAYALAAGGGLAAFLLTKDTLALALQIGSGIGTIITAPLALIERGLTLVSNGCLAQSFWHPYKCTCVEANETGGKEKIMEDWLVPIFGTTGKQYELRKACLQKEMKRAGWASTGDDQNVVSKCTGVIMDNPFACMTAQNWISNTPEFFTTANRTDEQEKDMWNQVWHCLDRNNPSFYPPQTEADVACEEAHGKQFRWDSKAGSCKNYALPGPNNPDPIGLQDPGAYTGEGEGCVIL